MPLGRSTTSITLFVALSLAGSSCGGGGGGFAGSDPPPGPPPACTPRPPGVTGGFVQMEREWGFERF